MSETFCVPISIGIVVLTVLAPQNNSSPQAQLFFYQLQNATQSEGYSFNGVYSCATNEDVESGNVYYGGQWYGNSGQPPTYQAIIDDMTAGSFSCAAMARQGRVAQASRAPVGFCGQYPVEGAPSFRVLCERVGSTGLKPSS
jgi:hypothetical protein